jgi:hypothetical protein
MKAILFCVCGQVFWPGLETVCHLASGHATAACRKKQSVPLVKTSWLDASGVRVQVSIKEKG